MFPIKDTIRSRSFSIVNWTIILANVLVFLFESALSPGQLNGFIDRFGLVPAHLNLTNPSTWYPLLTHMFLHGGWFHLLSNMWILIIFGDNVEDRLGSGRYLTFYIIGGVVAGLVQSAIAPDPQIPSIGASGAIAAVLGAYILFYPRARVITLILLVIFPWFIEIPAVIYLGIWFISQLFSGLASLGAQAGQWGGVAWWAHIGGFVFGLLTARLFAARRQPQRWFPDEYFPY
jgi:membrane associated rhomboid family serine protease